VTPSELPARLIPTRPPRLVAALAVTIAALGAALLLRVLVLGLSTSVGLTQTFYPAIMVVTLYAGVRWGAVSLAGALAIGWWVWSGRTGEALSDDKQAALALFVVAGGLIILVCAALRGAVLRLRGETVARAEAERALIDNTNRMHLALDSTNTGFWDWDIGKSDIYWSPAFLRNFGLSEDTRPSLETIVAAVHPEDQDRLRQNLQLIFAPGEPPEIEFRVLKPDGTNRWVLGRRKVIRDANGQVSRVIGVNVDVTAHKLMEERLRESERRFRALADSAPVPMWVSKLGGKREFVNRAYVEFLGTSFAEAVDFDWRRILHEDDLPRILKEQIAGETSLEPFTLEARYRNGRGEWVWLRSFSQPRYGPDGAFIGFIGIAFDITEAKRAQADLEHINDLLQERVAAALAERDAAEAALAQSQRLEAVGRLTGGVAHDFNNLLTVIIGALDILERHPEDVARRDRLVSAAVAAARRGERLTQQLLAFSRRQPLKPEIINLDPLICELEPLLHRALGDKAHLTLALGAGGLRIRVDVAQFEAALLNLLVNARDALSEGGEVSLRTARESLAAATGETPPGEYVTVEVRDNGKGMDAATLRQAFEPFFTTKSVGKGAGLGLSQVYGFVRQSGGGAEIESRPDEGTLVRLRLPVATGEPDAVEPAAEEVPAPASRTLTVMLVEDDAEVGDLFEAMLAELGHQVVRPPDPAEALKVIASDPRIGLLLTDVVMPGMNGLELAAEVMRRRPGLPIVLASGYVGEVLSAAEAAPWPLLKKPFLLSALAAAIAEALDNPQIAL
jgi:PAS domain S-box-containing protein